MESFMSDLVVAILVNYNGVKDTNECVKSLLSCGYSQLRIVIVATPKDIAWEGVISRYSEMEKMGLSPNSQNKH